MSLLKQLWLIVLVPGALALTGTLAVVLALGESHPASAVFFARADTTPMAAPDWFIDLIDPVLTASTAFAGGDSYAQTGHQLLWQAATWLALVFATTLLLGLALAWWVARHLRRALGQLTNQAQALGRHRFTTSCLPQTRELRQTTQALNRLSEGLRADALGQARRLAQRRQNTATEPALSVHLSGAARHDATFFNRLQGYLRAHDVPLLALDPLAAEDSLQALTLPFVKLEGALLEDTGQSRRRELLRGIVALCHAGEVLVIAQGVSSARGRAALLAMGIDGIAGVAVASGEATRLSA